MAMTITEKILARASGKKKVTPGELVQASVDLAIVHDMGARGLLPLFRELADKVWDPKKIVFVWDRFAPPGNIEWATHHMDVVEFTRKQGITFHDFDCGGIIHQVIHEKGHLAPGKVVVASDSHTCTAGAAGCFAAGMGSTEMAQVLITGQTWFKVPRSIKINLVGKLPPMVVGKDIILHVASKLGDDGAIYKTLEFAGPAVDEMSIDSRFTVTNMSVEIGAKNAIMTPDKKMVDYLKTRTNEPIEVVRSDPDAQYEKVIEFDISGLEPHVAPPYLPSNGKPVSKVAGVKVDQAFLGSCTNGRLEDLRMGAKLLKGRKVHPGVRLIVIPASQEIYAQASEEGLLSTFVRAGGTVCSPSCGACGGADKGTLGPGEVCISSSNRNFYGRMGDVTSKVYLANAATVVASAVKGEIADPREYA